MHQFIVSLVSFIILLSVMVFVHELGHFIVAKIFKVRVEAFSIGMGPRLFGYKYGETDYRICAFPVGGYVMMTGENMPGENLGASADATADNEKSPAPAPPLEPTPDPGALTSKPRWQRMLIGVAGPVANFIFALVLMFVYFAFINEVSPYYDKQVTIDYVPQGTEVAKAGIERGDSITRFGSKINPTFDQVIEEIEGGNASAFPVTVQRNGKLIDTTLQMPGDPSKPEEFHPDKLGLIPQISANPIGVIEATPGQPADLAGLKPKDQILSFDGIHFHSVNALLPYLQQQAGKPMDLVVLREGQTLHITAHPQPLGEEETGGKWRLGFRPTYESQIFKPLTFSKAASKSLAYTELGSTTIIRVLGKVLTNRMSAKTLAGPIGMAQMAGDAAEIHDYFSKFNLAALISVNLGILNLLPIPILDGGMIFILIIESIRRKDLNMAVKERIYQVAFVFLMVLFAFIIFNDLSRLDLVTKISHLFKH